MVIKGFAVLQILKNFIVVIAFLQLFPVQYFSLSRAGFMVPLTPSPDMESIRFGRMQYSGTSI